MLVTATGRVPQPLVPVWGPEASITFWPHANRSKWWATSIGSSCLPRGGVHRSFFSLTFTCSSTARVGNLGWRYCRPWGLVRGADYTRSKEPLAMCGNSSVPWLGVAPEDSSADEDSMEGPPGDV